jgi:hypothetical protein
MTRRLHIIALTLVAASIVGIVYVSFFYAPHTLTTVDIENFDVPTSTQSQVIKIYAEIFDRQPNSKELLADSTMLDQGKLTINGLKQRMIDSDEYSNLIKLQSNMLAPELPKMLSDRDMLTRISEIYKKECNKVIPEDMVLPLRDVYIYLDYNEWALIAMFRNPSYMTFEKDVQITPSMNNPQLMDIFVKYFNKYRE